MLPPRLLLQPDRSVDEIEVRNGVSESAAAACSYGP